MSGETREELEQIRQRYARREALPADRYAPLQPDVQCRVHERQRAMAAMLRRQGWLDLAHRDVVEVGCGAGGNLLEMLQWGAAPERLAGIDLLEPRVQAARARLPAAVHLHAGDASTWPRADASADLVLQFTVFSSILDAAVQARLAQAMWRWLRPGGAVLWYDFTWDNPRNRDVRGLPLRRVRELFPQAVVHARRITLAPPLARRLCALHPALYPWANALPLLRTHVLAWLEKPAS